MWKNTRRATLVVLTVGGLTMWASASQSDNTRTAHVPGNSYYLYTGAFKVSDTGVVELPPQYTWSVETSWRGPHLPDNRVVLRLHDAGRGFSALTAQMDLATAAKLHHELGEIIIQKLRNPDYQDREHITNGTNSPNGRLAPIGRD